MFFSQLFRPGCITTYPNSGCMAHFSRLTRWAKKILKFQKFYKISEWSLSPAFSHSRSESFSWWTLVPCSSRSRSFLSLKLSFLVPGRSGSLVIEFVLVPRTISNYSVLEQVCAIDWTLISQKFRQWTNSEQNEQLILSEKRTDHVRLERTSIMRTFWRQNFWNWAKSV